MSTTEPQPGSAANFANCNCHNTPENNLRFQIAFCETNLRYLSGETPRNENLISMNKEAIARAQQALENLAKTQP